ncbi:MAG: hypothetical protein KDD34_09180 [Bdellovibrionales bacterium]|nr:hypothetical protein [Bdellovibrionales bacterium]
MTLNKEVNWLVKSNGKILGPFSQLEIFELLKRKEIVVINEVAAPFRRWQYIRDLDEFAEIVEELRVLEFGSNEDHTMTTSSADQTASVTEKISTSVIDDLTDNVNPYRTDEIVIDDVKEILSTKKPPSVSKSQYQSPIKNNYIQQESDRLSRSIWIITICIVLSVSGYVTFHRLNKKHNTTNMTAEEFKEKALEHYYAGDYEKALPILRTAYNLDKHDSDIKSLIAPLMALLEPEKNSEVLKMVDDLVSSQTKNKERLLTLKALIQTKERNYVEAQKNLKLALSNNPFFWQAFSNLGVIDFWAGEYLTAKNYFETAISVETSDQTSRGEVYLMKVVSEIFLAEKEKNNKYLNDAKSELDSYLAEYQDYRQEAYLLQSYINFKLRDSRSARSSIVRMVNTDPMLTREHAKDPVVDRSPIAWNQLLPWCEDVVKELSTAAQAQTMHAICLIQNKGRDIDAKNEIANAISKDPKDPLTQSIFAFIHWALGDQSKAEMVASQAIELNQSKLLTLPHVIKARICEDIENYECAVENWLTVKALNPQLVSSYGGLAFDYLKLKKFTLFEISLVEGLKLSPFYKPLLRAQVLADQEGLNVDKK